jgi:SAM-dependent methyltransferase
MMANLHREIHEGLDRVSDARLGLVRRAFRMLPIVDRPRILDVGCGRGGTTREIARLSGGQVTGVDIDRRALDDLMERAEEENLSGRIRVVNRSMLEMDLDEGSIDVIWAEGSVHIVGFEVGLDAWRRFLAPKGCLVIHEMAWLRPDPPVEIYDRWRGVYPGIRTLREYVAEIPRHGYRSIDNFSVPEGFWWGEYYRPLEERLRGLRGKYRGDREALEILEDEQRDVDLYRKHSHWYGSAYMIMQNTAPEEPAA